MTNEQTATFSEKPSQVAPLLPPTADAPLPPRSLGFWKPFLLFWIVPRRLGPTLAAGIWKRAWLAHFLALVPSIVMVSATLLFVNGVKLEWNIQEPRKQLARAVIQLAAHPTSFSWNWLPSLLIVAALPLLELGLFFLGILLMPWCADGDGARSVLRRSIRNVLWSTTAFVPLAVAWCCAILLISGSGIAWLQSRFDVVPIVLMILLTGATVWILLRCLLVGACRYVGEADGPAFRPREPHCDQCGYLIVGLPLTTACPECGLSVCESLPGGRRQPTQWQKSELSGKGFFDLLRTQWLVLRDPSFFCRLPVQQGLPTARHFWWGTFLLFTGVALAAVRILLFFIPRLQAVETPIVTGVAVMVVPIVAQLSMMFTACLWSQVALGIRDYRISATTCYYASPLMWPAIGVLIIAAAIAVFAEYVEFDSALRAPFLVVGVSISLTVAQTCLAVMGLVFILCLYFWWVRDPARRVDRSSNRVAASA